MPTKPNELYNILFNKFGPQNWWPIDKKHHINNKSDPRFEIIIGAILTQNTSWLNVEKALENLKNNIILDIDNIINCNKRKLQKLVQPSGFYKQKTDRLIIISRYLKDNYNNNLSQFFNRDTQTIRRELLSLNGIGYETADSILLYAGDKPVFVVDAYTKRICSRIPFKTDLDYDSIQCFFQKQLSKSFSKKRFNQGL